MVNQIEASQDEILLELRKKFHCEVSNILRSSEYVALKSSNLRKLAKQKVDIIVARLSAVSGDSPELVLDALAQIIIDKTYTVSDIKKIIIPMLSKVQ